MRLLWERSKGGPKVQQGMARRGGGGGERKTAGAFALRRVLLVKVDTHGEKLEILVAALREHCQQSPKHDLE